MLQAGRFGLTVLGVTTGYIACALVGTALSIAPDGFAIIWPATAFLIGVLLILASLWLGFRAFAQR